MEQISKSLIHTKIYDDVPIEMRVVNPIGSFCVTNKDYDRKQ